jgi:hypothetical protein
MAAARLGHREQTPAGAAGLKPDAPAKAFAGASGFKPAASQFLPVKELARLPRIADN